MSICRTTILETHTKEDADSLLADYIENFDSMFPECTLTINSRNNPTTLVSNSVYPDQETIEKTIYWYKKHANGHSPLDLCLSDIKNYSQKINI